jgi:iron only hydrogenase large subunit-like protein
MLVSLQSHSEVLGTLDAHPSLVPPWTVQGGINGHAIAANGASGAGKIFVASVSPQVEASLAAACGVTAGEVKNMISQLLSGPGGLAAGGAHGSSFLWVLDTNTARSMTLVAAAEEVAELLGDMKRIPSGDGVGIADQPKRPILTSACPGWICYAEKTHPHILPHLSRLKSPQAVIGTLVKSVLYKKYNIHPSQVWHLAIMPCFDKKLEASRSELMSTAWLDSTDSDPVRDVDCVITARELVSLAEARNISFFTLPRTPLPSPTPFPDPTLNAFLFPPSPPRATDPSAGTSGGYLHHILQRLRAQHPTSAVSVSVTRGRNADVVEYTLRDAATGAPLAPRLARCYGFRNIQNLVRRLRPPRASRLLAVAGARGYGRGAVAAAGGGGGGAVRASGQRAGEPGADYLYVEVMACPGGCANGGGQIRVEEADVVGTGVEGEAQKAGLVEQRAWLAKVEGAYWAGDGGPGAFLANAETEDEGDVVDGISRKGVLAVVDHWSGITGVDGRTLLCTSYRKVESDVGKKVSDVDRVVGLASSLGGGW